MTSPRVSAIIGEIKAEIARQDKQLADIAGPRGLSAASLSRKLNGRTDFALGELIDLCDTLGVPLAELTRRAEQHGSVSA